MNRLTALLNQLQADEAAARTQIEQKELQHQATLRAQSEAALQDYFGDYSAELMPLIFATEESTILSAGRPSWQRSWSLGSHDLQLTPIKIRWTEATYGAGSLTFTTDGSEGKTYTAQTSIINLLLFARTAYPAYKAKVDELAQRNAQIEADKRKDLITNLAWPANWRSHRTAADIQRAYDQLVDLGATELAEQRMAEYRADVAAVHQREQQALARKAAYETAMTAYRQEMAAYDEDCRAWAESEQFLLWEPHTLWRIRYTSLLSAHHAGSDGDDYIQTIITLDSPSDIITQIQAHGMAQVDRVRCDGTMLAGFTLVAFLDAEPLHYTTPPTETYQFHRAYHAGDHTVYVPPFILDEPAPAPIRPTAPQCDEQGDQW